MKTNSLHLFQVALFLLLPFFANANTAQDVSTHKKQIIDALKIAPVEFISKRVQENHTFYGLASYYNSINYYIIGKNNQRRLEEGDLLELNNSQWLVIVGRLNVLLIQATGLSVHLDGSMLIIDNPEILSQSNAVVKIVTKPELPSIAPELDQIRYAHLWIPFAWLAKLTESSFISIQTNIVSNWGFVIVIFSVLLKLLLLPVSVMTVRFQRRVSQVQTQLAPRLAEIKANHDGEEAHNHLMDAHKALGVSPFYTLKPMLGSFIQIPILIAVFNALGEMPQFDNQSFLWISNLAYPDAIGHLPFAIPMFGNTISLLPFIMTIVTIYSTIIFKNSHASNIEMKRQKRNLYFMSAAFFVLFYPFPAAMVLYWTMNNILHIFQQKIIKI